MESYDIIANQPVVIDNVRPGSWGEGGRPAPGSHAARGGTPPVWARPLRVARRGPRAAWPWSRGLGAARARARPQPRDEHRGRAGVLAP